MNLHAIGESPPRDYVVAIYKPSCTVIDAWEGGDFRCYDLETVIQGHISMARSEEDAREQAMKIYKEMRKGGELS